MSHPVASQRLRGQTEGKLPCGKKVMIPAGAFIRCVRKEYMPKYHPFLEEDNGRGYNEVLYVAAFTQFGMALIANVDIDWNVY